MAWTQVTGIKKSPGSLQRLLCWYYILAVDISLALLNTFKTEVITRDTGLVMSDSELISVKQCRTFSPRLHTNPKDLT